MTSATSISMGVWLQKLLACNSTQRAKEDLQPQDYSMHMHQAMANLEGI